MTIELSIVPTSSDGSSFEIIPRDVTGISDADQRRPSLEAKESLYSRLLIFGREPSKRSRIRDLEASRDYPSGVVSSDDLEPLRSYSSGVYILINTKSTSKNRHSVFVGMAGIDLEMERNYLDRTGIYLETVDANCQRELFQCLLKQSENPPPNMSNWDLAIVIPRQNYIPDFFEKLCNMLNEFEDILSHHKSLRHRVPSRDRVSHDYASFLMISPPSIPPDGADYLMQLISDVITRVGLGLLLEFAKRLLWKRPKRQESHSSTFVIQNFRPKMRIKGSNVFMPIGDVTNNHTNINVAFVAEDQRRPEDFEE